MIHPSFPLVVPPPNTTHSTHTAPTYLPPPSLLVPCVPPDGLLRPGDGVCLDHHRFTLVALEQQQLFTTDVPPTMPTDNIRARDGGLALCHGVRVLAQNTVLTNTMLTNTSGVP
jgi:hypothetical protein